MINEVQKFLARVGEFDLTTKEIEREGDLEMAERRWKLSTRWLDHEAREAEPAVVVQAGKHLVSVVPTREFADAEPYIRHTGLALLSTEGAIRYVATDERERRTVKQVFGIYLEQASVTLPRPNSVQARNVDLAIRGLHNLRTSVALIDPVLDTEIMGILLTNAGTRPRGEGPTAT
jgi:hypothetical protein